MARHHRRPAKPGEVSPDSDEGLNVGLAEPPLPGGQNHLVNHPVADHPEFPKVHPPYYSGMMAHGVVTIPEGDHGDHTYPEGGRIAPNSEDQAKIQATKSVPIPEPTQAFPPVPVRIVPDNSKGHPLKILVTNRVPVGQGDPVDLCMRDSRRSALYLLNEDPTNDVRFSSEWPTVSSGGGAILPHAMASYQKFETQERLYAFAVTGSSSVYVSVVMETEIDAAVP